MPQSKDKTLYENMVGTIIQGGSSDEKRAAFRLMKSESAKMEAELVSIFTTAQREIVAELSRLKANDLVTYHTEAALARVQGILSQMLGNSRPCVEQMAEANILSGRIGALATSSLKGPELVKASQLTSLDKSRVERMVEQFMGNLSKGAALTMASARNTVQNASVRANLPNPIQPSVDDKDKAATNQTKESDKQGKEIQKQEAIQSPVSNMNSPDSVEAKKPQRIFKPKTRLSNADYKELTKNPVLFATKRSQENVNQVVKLRNEYVLGRRENDPLRSAALRAQALKEAKGSSAAKAAFDMQEQLRKEGVAAFIDRGGHKWTLANYCAMSARTTSRQSANFGEIFGKEDHDLYYIVPHGSACPICAKYEGRVYSRSGKNPNYPPLAKAFTKIDPNGSDDLDNTYLTIHPNCRHVIVRYIERAQTKQQLEAIRKRSNLPFDIDPRTEQQKKEYELRQKINSERNAAMREYQAMLQVIPVRELGTFPTFEKHRKANDSVYKRLKARYKELSGGKTK